MCRYILTNTSCSVSVVGSIVKQWAALFTILPTCSINTVTLIQSCIIINSTLTSKPIAVTEAMNREQRNSIELEIQIYIVTMYTSLQNIFICPYNLWNIFNRIIAHCKKHQSNMSGKWKTLHNVNISYSCKIPTPAWIIKIILYLNKQFLF